MEVAPVRRRGGAQAGVWEYTDQAASGERTRREVLEADLPSWVMPPPPPLPELHVWLVKGVTADEPD